MPRSEEAESSEHLNQLLDDLQASEGLGRDALVAAHLAALFAGIESAPALGTWPLGDGSSAVSARWVETVLGSEIDRRILRMLDNPDGCPDCLFAWIRHLIAARTCVSQWAWAREAREVLG